MFHSLSRLWHKRTHTAFKHWQIYRVVRSHSQSDSQNARRLLLQSRLQALKHVVVARVNRVTRHVLHMWRGVADTQGVYRAGLKLRYRLIERVGATWLKRHKREKVTNAFLVWYHASRTAEMADKDYETRAKDRRRHEHAVKVRLGMVGWL